MTSLSAPGKQAKGHRGVFSLKGTNGSLSFNKKGWQDKETLCSLLGLLGACTFRPAPCKVLRGWLQLKCCGGSLRCWSWKRSANFPPHWYEVPLKGEFGWHASVAVAVQPCAI